MRGKHPKDSSLFADSELIKLREAALDLRYLLNRGYARPSSLKLVGDRFQLRQRQRQLLFRAITDGVDAQKIVSRKLAATAAAGAKLVIDGHNLLITLETALAGGLLIYCDDSFVRDLAEAHGSYRYSSRTTTAIGLLQRGVEVLAPSNVTIFVDRPMPFSGELASQLQAALGDNIEIAVADSADYEVKSRVDADAEVVVISSDSVLLRHAPRSFDLAESIIGKDIEDAWLIDIREESGTAQK